MNKGFADLRLRPLYKDLAERYLAIYLVSRGEIVMYLTKRGKLYQINFIHPLTGKMTSQSTKTRNKAEALKILAEFDPISLNQKNDITLEAFKKEFLIYSEIHHRPNTHDGYKHTFKYFYEYAGNIMIKDITTQFVNSYLQLIQTKGLLKAGGSLYQTRKDRIHLSRAFNWAIKAGYIKNNPVTDSERVKLPQRMPMFFTKEEFSIFVSNLPSEDLKDLYTFTLNTGLREQEVLNLRWNQIKWDYKLLILDNQNHITKNRRIRSIPLNKTALSIVLNRRMNSYIDLVFTREGKKIHPDYIAKITRKALKMSCITKKLCFHSLRHTFASLLVQNGVSIYVVKELLGHSDVRTTQIYSHLRLESLNGSTDLLDQ